MTASGRSFIEDYERIVAQVQVQKQLGSRAARRFVGRRINEVTLGVWRQTGRFPLGFRRGSKGPAR